MSSGTFTPSSANTVPSRPQLQLTEEHRNRNDANDRSAAIERAYVHDVYENCEETASPMATVHGPRPKVAQFIAGLDAGSFVCDVGCGDGRYLSSINPFVYSMGVDRCIRLTKVARSKGAEVAICDNLELPFRDESFDAVISLAVIHHFATTERRVGAIRELARILRIGGRVIITVWAFEQKNRFGHFESQDVLVPWQPPKVKTTNTSDGEADEDEDDVPFLPYQACTEESTNSSRSAGDNDSSSDRSSHGSPGETCYSFVRRAIQKLAGGKKNPWFLDTLQAKDNKIDSSSLDFEDARDLPIELRRLEDFDDVLTDPPLSAGLKSRSLGSILNPPPKMIVRSRSSVPSLAAQTDIEHVVVENVTIANTVGSLIEEPDTTTSKPAISRRPKLVKQKQSLCDEDAYILPETNYKDIIKGNERSQFLRKQSSLNEELMAENRLKEKEKIRKRIQKQISLNETFLCRSSMLSKRLQVIRQGFTTKLKTSTGSLERVTKNGIVKIMQNIKSGVHGHSCPHDTTASCSDGNKSHSPLSKSNSINSGHDGQGDTDPNQPNEDEKTRRQSRESGSDSSKDSSLQSDTSIESEDSFASVIYIPNPDKQTPEATNSQIIISTVNTKNHHYSNNNKVPCTSPLVMTCCPTPAHSPSLLQFNNNNNNNINNSYSSCSSGPNKNQAETTRFPFDNVNIIEQCDELTRSLIVPPLLKQQQEQQQQQQQQNRVMSTVTTKQPMTTTNKTPTSSQVLAQKQPTAKPKLTTKITRQTIKELPQIPKFKKHASFPLIRRTTTSIQPKLLSLELFNPATDDLDSDESDEDVSSPDSIDSVINASASKSAKSNESTLTTTTTMTTTTVKTTTTSTEKTIKGSSGEVVQPKPTAIVTGNVRQLDTVIRENNKNNHKQLLTNDTDIIISSDNSFKPSLNETSIFSHNDEQNRQHLVDFAKKLSAQLLKELDDNSSSSSSSDSNNFFHDTTDPNKSASATTCNNKTSDNQYKLDRKIINLDDPYLKKLNGDIKDLNLMREELRERRLLLANLGCSSSGSSSSRSFDYFNGGSSHNSNLSLNSAIIHEEDESHDELQEIDEDFSDLKSASDTALLLQEEDSSEEHIVDSQNNNNNDTAMTQPRYGKDMATAANNNNNRVHFNLDTTTIDGDDDIDVKDNAAIICVDNNNKKPMESRSSVESWANSTPSTLDSPAGQSSGGQLTHHRYYHVFREGELDALINRNVNSLHIVSSYYERASWCIVAEKVHVWTI